MSGSSVASARRGESQVRDHPGHIPGLIPAHSPEQDEWTSPKFCSLPKLFSPEKMLFHVAPFDFSMLRWSR
jgi:hypothetical protein